MAPGITGINRDVSLLGLKVGIYSRNSNRLGAVGRDLNDKDEDFNGFGFLTSISRGHKMGV